MTTTISVNGQLYFNSGVSAGAPAFDISGDLIKLINATSGVVTSNSSSAPAIRISGSNGTIENQTGGIIRSYSLWPFYDAILGGNGNDKVINAGTIIGTVYLGSGDDAFLSTGTIDGSVDMGTGDDRIDYSGPRPVSAEFLLGDGNDALSLSAPVGSTNTYNILADGGAGTDTLTLSGLFGDANGSLITGFENLVIDAQIPPSSSGYANNLIGLSGFNQISITPGSAVFFLDSINPLVDLAIEGGSISINGSSAFKNIQGSNKSDYLQISGNSQITGNVYLADGDDVYRFDIFNGTYNTPVTIDGGSGFDWLSLLTLPTDGPAVDIDLSIYSNFEALNYPGLASISDLTLRHVDGFQGIDLTYRNQLHLVDSISPNAYLNGSAGVIDIASTSIIGRYGFGLPGSISHQGLAMQKDVDPFYDTIIYNHGQILGDVELYFGNDIYDGTDGTAGGTIYGFAGDDILKGGVENNIIDGGYGNDTLHGGAGNDIFSYNDMSVYTVRDFGQDIIADFNQGQDKIDLSALHIADMVTLLPFMSQSGSDTLISFFYEGVTESITIKNILPHQVSASDFIFDISSNALGVTGTNGSDVLFGGSGADTLNGGIGNDVLTGGAGDDVLDGGLGGDQLVGGLGNDNYYVDDAGDNIIENANAGTDSVFSSISFALRYIGGSLDNLILLGSGNINGVGNALTNIITGNSGDNFLDGDHGDDTLYGGAGDDALDGGAGLDTLIGSTGDDSYFVDSDSDIVIELLNEGIDTILSTSWYILPQNVENLTLLGGGNYGVGNDLANILTGNIVGNNSLHGQEGDDTIVGGSGEDTLYGGVGNDVLYGDAGNDILIAEDGIDIIYGGAGDDVIFGGNGSDILWGDDGDDALVGGAGPDSLHGGNGFDFAAYTTANGVTADLLFALTQNTGDAVGDSYVAIEGIMGSSLDDDLRGDNYDNKLIGYTGDDYLSGRDGSDVLYGFDGHDSLDGGSGADQIFGDTGNDTIAALGDGDVIDGGSGVDAVDYGGLARGYGVSAAGGVAQVALDRLSAVEDIHFRDATLSFDVNSDAAFIMRMYDSVLSREPDAAGFDYWNDFISNGGARVQMAAAFLGSVEFAPSAGLNDSDFVEFLYTQTLGRGSDPGGKAYWVGVLGSGTARADILVGFSESVEHQALTQGTLDKGLWTTDQDFQDATLLYDAFANRLPDQGGLLYWAGQLENGATLHDVAAAFTYSPEFQGNIAGFTNAQIVDFMYMNTLDRSADPGGQQYWVNAMNNGLSTTDLLMNFAFSPEHTSNMQPYLYQGVEFI